MKDDGDNGGASSKFDKDIIGRTLIPFAPSPFQFVHHKMFCPGELRTFVTH